MNCDDIELLIFGDTAIDHFYEVEEIPRLNNAANVISFRKFYGGMGANTAVVARALGIKTALVSVIGTDAEDYRKYMENLGIKLYLKGIFGDTTRSIFFKENKNQISFFYKGVTEKLDELDLKRDLELDREDIESAKCVYMARTYLGLQKRVSRYCKSTFLVYNPGYGVFEFKKIPKRFISILRNVDVLILNEYELKHLNEIGFKIKFSLGPRIFLITKGVKGCSVYSKNVKVDVPIFKTRVIDESGAGDAFNAGFIAAYIRGFDVYNSVKIGNATASFIVEGWGCQSNLPTWDAVMERYKKI
ncbi:MAG: hypothetical protein DRO90_00615 [Candidatus Altiarchaeales archaeon]|nr:MAG: hypothetical protein DRO95_05985 [Candidatus Altiarchaeales archaeon]RLI94726.1 MAG: hypothetical protein DRO94_02255 [Candidatus Altiarchaeales archaeon]RLI95278.1 MAG: hypothetical protein DRO90_00615 [Candidatus Altiarchaeales archaeon]HDO82518.1 hypothetical protein [Candidatus Altiarchaeales archaeon]HEX55167.1 hypothetical protein [Candidatus Altiarchaeales archaeon]